MIFTAFTLDAMTASLVFLVKCIVCLSLCVCVCCSGAEHCARSCAGCAPLCCRLKKEYYFLDAVLVASVIRNCQYVLLFVNMSHRPIWCQYVLLFVNMSSSPICCQYVLLFVNICLSFSYYCFSHPTWSMWVHGYYYFLLLIYVCYVLYVILSK